MINGYKMCILSNKIQPQNTKTFSFTTANVEDNFEPRHATVNTKYLFSIAQNLFVV